MRTPSPTKSNSRAQHDSTTHSRLHGMMEALSRKTEKEKLVELEEMLVDATLSGDVTGPSVSSVVVQNFHIACDCCSLSSTAVAHRQRVGCLVLELGASQ